MQKTLKTYGRAILRLYSWSFPWTLLKVYQRKRHNPLRVLSWFWQTNTFKATGTVGSRDQSLATLLLLIMLSQIIYGVWLLVEWARFGRAGYMAFGLAVLFSYPLVLVHLFAFVAGLVKLVMLVSRPKKLARAILAHWMESHVRALRRRHHFKVVAVAGSVGKTNTKTAIAELLGQQYRVQYQRGNYNDRLTVPLVFFGQNQPALYDVFAWLRLLGEQAAAVHHPYEYDVVVVELGSDGPGQIAEFAYLKPDVGVLTAITPEHMEYFGTLDAVAQEETTIFEFAKHMLVNADDTPGKYVAEKTFSAYSIESDQDDNYYAKRSHQTLQGQKLHVRLHADQGTLETVYTGAQGAKITLAAASVAHMLGMTMSAIHEGAHALRPYSGRMQVLEGIQGTTIIDDTYNSTPIAAKAALDVLYDSKTLQRIAILGSMNELGDYAKTAHMEVGAYCDAEKLHMVVTVGADAKRWLAPEAKAQGCQVHSFESPYEAGAFVRKHLKKGGVILGKGSQNRIFVEEALKLLLSHPSDATKLVRQSASWLGIKAKQFKNG